MENKITTKWSEDVKQAAISIGNVGSCICTIYHNGKAKVMIIDSVYVNEQYGGKGYGQKLMNAAIDLAKASKIDSVELNVNKDNKVAIDLYEKNGFEVTDKHYYRLILNKWI